MPDDIDPVCRYGLSVGLNVRSRTIIVEGKSDADLFEVAAHLEERASGIRLLGNDLAIIAAGNGDRGGTSGVIRELACLRGLARACLNEKGVPKYRFVGLFDDDRAGKQAVRSANAFDRSILEYKDVFRLRPTMPLVSNGDPGALQKAFESANAAFKGLEWELEDLLPEAFVSAFTEEHPSSIAKTIAEGGRVHREFTRDGKARFHQFIRANAMREDLIPVIDLLSGFRRYLALK